VAVSVHPQRWHFFDAESGDRVEPLAAAGTDRAGGHGGPVAAVR